MSTPDVRVRLSQEGLKEVLFALRELQKEGAKTNRAAAGGVGLVSNAVKDLKALLPTLGLAAVVGGFAALTKQAVATADATGKIQQRVGGTVEDISGLTLAFRTNESSQQGLQDALQKTSNLIAEVKAGNEETAASLAAVGVSAEAFASADAPRALEQIAKGLAAIPPGAERAAAAQKLFGKNSRELLVALDAVGEQGIDAFIERARELGVLIDEDLAKAAARANDSLGIIRIQAEGLATQFAAGLAPAVADAMETFSTAITGEGINGMRTFGQVVGFIIRAVVTLFVGLGKEIGATIAKIGTFVSSVIEASKAIAQGDLAGATDALRRGAERRLAIERDLQADLAKLGKDLFAGPSAGGGRGGAGGGEVATQAAADAKKAADARAAAQKAALATELKIQQEYLKSAEQANLRSYEQGLISLDEYYGKRHELAQRAAEIEIAALQAERAQVTRALAAATPASGASEADRIKLRQELARINGEIAAKEIQTQRELAALAADEVDAQKALTKERNELATRLDELEGRRHAAFQRNLEEEIRQIRELGVRAGQTAAEIESQVARFSAARTGQFNAEEATRAGTAALQAFQRDQEQIRRDIESGIISQLEGEQRLIQLEAQRIEGLRELAKQMLAAAAATGDPEQIERAQQFSDSIGQIEASYRAATDMAAQFRQAGIESFQGGLESLLANAQKLESVEDAFRQLALTVAQSMQQIAAEIISKQATLALLNAFGLGTGGLGAGGAGAATAAATETAAGTAQTAQLQVAATQLTAGGASISAGAASALGSATQLIAGGSSITAAAAALSAAAIQLQAAATQLQIANSIGVASGGGAGAFKGGLIRGYAGGGEVWGKKLPISGPDKIPIMAQEGEFMMRRSRVREPGALSFLRAWNTGQFTLRQALRMKRYAEGGEIGPGSTAAPSGGGGASSEQGGNSLRIVNVLDPELVNEALASASGERTMLNVIERNSQTVKRMLGK